MLRVAALLSRVLFAFPFFSLKGRNPGLRSAAFSMTLFPDKLRRPHRHAKTGLRSPRVPKIARRQRCPAALYPMVPARRFAYSEREKKIGTVLSRLENGRRAMPEDTTRR